MSESKTFDELMREHWAESRKEHLRHITYIVGDEEREGYVEVDDLNERFIPIRDSEACDRVITYVNSDCIREYRLKGLTEQEQENWELTVELEATMGRII